MGIEIHREFNKGIGFCGLQDDVVLFLTLEPVEPLDFTRCVYAIKLAFHYAQAINRMLLKSNL